jgi:CHAT domain-containing protein
MTDNRQRQYLLLPSSGSGKLRGIKQEDGAIPLPPELAKIGNKDLEHPYYWSAFTMIGSPW